MKWILLAFLLTAIYETQESPLPLCPSSCSCSKSESRIEAHCQTFNFLTKIPKEEKHITSLYVHNATAKELHPNTLQLKNLKILSLKFDKLTLVKPSLLPNSLEYLDLSQNSIKDLHEGWNLLPNLKEINLLGNPICACDLIDLKDELITKDEKFANCDSLKHAREDRLVICKQNDLMQNDAAEEGSGEEENQEEVIRGKLDSIIEGYVPTSAERELEEGSGGSGDHLLHNATDVSDVTEYDEDYDYGDTGSEPPFVPVVVHPDMTPVKTCYFNCSTPPPLEKSNETHGPPGLIEGFEIMIDDLDITGEEDTTAGPDTTTEFSTYLALSEIATQTPGIYQKSFETPSDKTPIEQSQLSTYIFLAVLLLIVVCLIIYAIIKKRKARQQQSQLNKINGNDASHDQEMKLLNKEQDIKPNGTHEAVPLINGHESQQTNGKPNDVDQYVELRPKIQMDEEKLLTPETKRVTIKASEIPNSTPKTPILVNRHLSNDGNMVTTPYIDEEV